jgi:predicted SnoaL-like aldol condensation-catalyzing enzyme
MRSPGDWPSHRDALAVRSSPHSCARHKNRRLGKFFAQITRERARGRVVVHRIIAVGDYVWAHVNFLNLFNDDPEDTGIAGVDIYKMDADGKAIEHWDTLQIVGDPKNSAPMIAPNIPRANANGMF